MARRHELSDDQWMRSGIDSREGGRPGTQRAEQSAVRECGSLRSENRHPVGRPPGALRKTNSVWKRFDRWCAPGRLAESLPGDRLSTGNGRNCRSIPKASRLTRCPRRVGASRAKKRGRRPPPLPGPLPRRTDNQSPRRDRKERPTDRAASDRRSARRCSGSRTPAGSLRTGRGGNDHRRTSLRFRRHPPALSPPESESLHQTASQSQTQKEIQQNGLQAPQPDRTLLRTHQTLPPNRHSLRKEAQDWRNRWEIPFRIEINRIRFWKFRKWSQGYHQVFLFAFWNTTI